jgi:UDP-glucose 4-epimerase
MLLDAMKAHKVKILIYSSTCATYGEPKRDANHRRYTADPKGRL